MGVGIAGGWDVGFGAEKKKRARRVVDQRK